MPTTPTHGLTTAQQAKLDEMGAEIGRELTAVVHGRLFVAGQSWLTVIEPDGTWDVAKLARKPQTPYELSEVAAEWLLNRAPARS
jgi:hypothetical protein